MSHRSLLNSQHGLTFILDLPSVGEGEEEGKEQRLEAEISIRPDGDLCNTAMKYRYECRGTCEGTLHALFHSCYVTVRMLEEVTGVWFGCLGLFLYTENEGQGIARELQITGQPQAMPFYLFIL